MFDCLPTNITGRAGILLIAAAMLAGCSAASEKYGLTPTSQTTTVYPNINVNPAAPPAVPPLSPAERAKAEADLVKAAGKAKTD